METSLKFSDLDGHTGGSIRDRIAALSAAAGVSRFEVTLNNERSRSVVASFGMNVKPEPEERESTGIICGKGVAFSVEFQKAAKPVPSPRLMSRKKAKELGKKKLEKTLSERENVDDRAFEVVNGCAFGTFENKEVKVIEDSNGGVTGNNEKEIRVVSSRDIGMVKDKSLAFELSFDDEPRSKRLKDMESPVLLRSPFKSFRPRSSRNQHQIKSNAKLLQSRQGTDVVGSDIFTESTSLQSKENNLPSSLCSGSDKDFAEKARDTGKISSQHDGTDAKVFKQIKRNTFTLDSVSKYTAIASVVASSEFISNEECSLDLTLRDKQSSSNREEQNLRKRNTFTLDTVLTYAANSSSEEIPVVKSLSELVIEGNSRADLTHSGHQILSNYKEQTFQKQTTSALDSFSQFLCDSSEHAGTTSVKAFNEVACKDDCQDRKNRDQSIKHHQKRHTYTLESVDQEGLQVSAHALNEESRKDEPLSERPKEKAQTRAMQALDAVSQSVQDASGRAVEVSSVLNDLASKEESKHNKEKADEESLNDTSQKRSTFTLEKVSQEIDNVIEEYFPGEIEKQNLASSNQRESLEKRSTYTLDPVSHALQAGAEEGVSATRVLSLLAQQENLCLANPSPSAKSEENRRTFSLDDVSKTLEESRNNCLLVADGLILLSDQEQSKSVRVSDTEVVSHKRGTFPLESVSQTLEEAQEKRLLSAEVRCQLASEGDRHIFGEPLTPAVGHQSSSEKRGTYTLDTVSHAIEEAVEKGFPVSVTLDHLSQEGKSKETSSAAGFTSDLRASNSYAQSSDHSDEFEASFEYALEQLEDCVTLDNDETCSTSSLLPSKRGTYDLDDVSSSLLKAAIDGVPVVKTLDRLSKQSSSPRKDAKTSRPSSEQNRGTYTLDEVSRSLEAGLEQGIPVIEALHNLSNGIRSRSKEGGEGKRGTYTLDEVSKSLEHAKQTGIPVIEALESLAKDKRKSPLRLKMPDRGTYTMDEVSLSLEKAKEKGIPIVDALGHMTMYKDPLIQHTPDAVYRRQEKLVNRKTYALASPLETIGEGSKLRLYDGNQRQMMSPISFNVKSKDTITTKADVSKGKVGVVKKLDFLTSACELLLQANAKDMDRDQHRTSSTQINAVDDKELGNLNANPDQSPTARNTYPLESVSLTIDDAKARGIPVLEALDDVSSSVKTSSDQRTIITRCNSKSDSEIIASERKEELPDRQTHSLENVSRTLEDAQKAGIPVIQALEQLTNELAEFSLGTTSGNLSNTNMGKENRKRKHCSEIAIGRYQDSGAETSPQVSPYPPSIRKAHSLDDVAFAVRQAFQTGTSLTDLLDDMAFQNAVEPVSCTKDVRPRSVDSGFLSSFSDNDISSHSERSPRNRSNTYILDSSNEDLDLAKKLSSDQKTTGLSIEAISRPLNQNQEDNRGTFTLGHVKDLSRDLPVIEALEKLSVNTKQKTVDQKHLVWNENGKKASTDSTLPCQESNLRRKVSPPKPKRQFFKKPKQLHSKSNSPVIADSLEEPVSVKYQTIDSKVVEVINDNKDAAMKDNLYEVCAPFVSAKLSRSESYDIDLVPSKDPSSMGPKSKVPVPVLSSTPYRERATWRPSGTVLDKIANLMDAAEDCGISPTEVLNQVTDTSCSEPKGEIEASQGEAEDDQAVTSQLALLRMQLDEKRRLIEAEKHRAQTEWEDQRRRLGQTAFWYVIGKAQGSEGTVMQTDSQDKQRKAMGEFSDQVSPPIAWSSPANSPLPSTVIQSSSDGQQLETREFLLSDYPPGVNENMHPLSESAVEVNSRDSPVAPRPPSHDSAATRNAAFARKCWDVDVGVKASPVPLTRPDSTAGSEDIKQGTALSEGCITKELEEENHSSVKKGLAMFIGDDENVGSQGLTPEQEKKKEKFLRLRQKKQEEDRTRKEVELEKKRKRDEKLREKEFLRKVEQERLRQDDLERVRIEQETRTKEAQATRVADPQGTYRRQGPWQQAYDVSGDANGYIGQGHQQPSGFAEFSGPQCYVKPSGKSNRKIIVNAISHVCLSGTVNQEQKEKCLQALSECDGHHFMILFRDGVKFRGIYIHNLDNDQLYKVFGIGPRLVTSKMIEFLYKYNSGGKEFTKIPSKTISLSVDGFGIQKSCWNTGKPVVASKTSSNLKRPPRPPQR
ncbi:fap1 adhesin-like isoform X1 [Montipora capricornis]|uniref:fap1 adhesin-like isoform X1 n=1 Tax=Montipora capricornis TaxID=246305 RepID=UPI0035F1B004